MLTARGGMTSHAAVVARGMGKPCVAGRRRPRSTWSGATFRSGDHVVNEGEVFTIDGSTARCILGAVPLAAPA